jgi:choice-of-anchor A domain-containing protein
MIIPFKILAGFYRQIGLRSLLALAVSICAVVGAEAAHASPITLGTAANYGVVTGLGETFTVGGGFKLTGNLGLGAGYNVQISGNNSQTGTTYYDGSNGGAWSNSGTYTSGGSVNQSMTQVMSDAVTASSAAAAATATAGLVDQGGSISLSGSSVTIKALTNLSENVLDISALSLTNGTLTFDDNGHTGAKFIINVTGAFSAGVGAVIKGINGASGADIIFNIEGTGSTVNLTGNSSTSLIGTILAPQRNVTLGGGGSLTGALIAGVNNAGKSYTTTESSSGYNITSLGYTPRTVINTPEPSSVAIFGAGIAVLIAIRRRLRPSRPSLTKY